MDSIREIFTLRIDATLPSHVTSAAWTALSFRCEEGVNEFYRVDMIASLSFKGKDDPKDDADIVLAVLNSPAALSIDGGTDARVFPGLVTECEVLGGFPHSGWTVRFFRIEIRPRLWVQSRTRRTRTFVDKTVSQIVEDMLKEQSAAASQASGVATSGGYIMDLKLDGDDAILNAKRAFVLQHDETDADFLLRWLERQGWFFYYHVPPFRKEADLLAEAVVVANRNPSVAAWSKPAPMTVDEGSARGIYSLRGKASMIPGQIKVRDYDPNNPGLKLNAAYPEKAVEKALPPLSPADEFFAMNDEGAALARRRYQSFLCRRTVFMGESNLPCVCAGYAFECADSKYLFLSARHEGAVPNEQWLGFTPPPGTPAAGYRNRFVCIADSAEAPFVPQRQLPWPKIRGVLTGWIMERPGGRAGDPWRDSQSDNKKIDRYRVFLEVDPDASENAEAHSVFMRWQTPSSGKERGFSAVMYPGTEVQVSFQDGNPDRPFISGTVANANTPVLAWGADEKLFSMTTPRGKEITVTEDRGADAIMIASAANPAISISNNSIDSLASYKTDNVNLTAQTNAMELVDFAQLCHMTSTDASFNVGNLFSVIGQLANNGMAALTSFAEKKPRETPGNIAPLDPATSGAATTFGKSGMLSLIINAIFMGLEFRKELKKTRGRVTITANPEATSILQTVAPNSVKDMGIFTARLIATLTDHINQCYSRFGKPIKNDPRNKSISVPDGLAIGNLLAHETSMVMLLIKLILSAHRNRGDGSGIVMNAVGGMTGFPPKYRNLDISMRADGSVIAEADKNILLSATAKDETKNAILHLSSGKSPLDSKERADGDISAATLTAYRSVDISGQAQDSRINLTTPDAGIGIHGANVTVFSKGRTEIGGDETLSVASGKELTLSGKNASIMGEKSLAIHYGSGGNLVLGSDKQGQPSIAFNTATKAAEKVLAENVKRGERQNELAAARRELEMAERNLRGRETFLAYVEDDINQTGYDPALRTALKLKRTEAKAKVSEAAATLSGKIAAAKEATEALNAQEKKYASAVAAAVGPNALLLANGPDGKEKIVINQADVVVESSAAVEIKAGGKSAKFQASGFNIQGVIDAKGGMITIG